MELHPEVSAALDRILAIGTWYRPHPADWDRWYDFVDAYARFQGHDLIDSDLREEIASRVTACGGRLNGTLEAAIDQRVRAAMYILEFLRRRGRWGTSHPS